ncbi:MAG: signal peptidase II [Thermoleophilia bacterium]|nr:signal peptidase II [Thermoleophilia bacterium]
MPVMTSSSDLRRERDIRAWIVKWGTLGVTASAAFALDLLTKRLVEERLVLGEVHEVVPFFSLQRVGNKGVAFGMLAEHSLLIQLAPVAALLVIVAYVMLERRSLLAGLAGGMLVGGSLGNLVQRITVGQVTDFLKFPHWPNFNLADVFIFLGVALVLLSFFWEPDGRELRRDRSEGGPTEQSEGPLPPETPS